MDNSNYIWKDFTKDDLKAWILANTDIQDWNHCHDIELNKEQLTSLCNAIGCENISPENIWIYFSDTISPEQWWIGTDDNSEITLTFSDIYKKVKGESLNNNLRRAKTRGVDSNSEEGNILVLRNIRSVSAGIDLKDTYKLTPNETTFLDYIELTNDTISGNSNTSGSKLHWNSYLTRLGKYGIDNKQFKIISYPTNAPVWGDNEGYQFSDKQNYGNNIDTNNSKKYEDWTVNNPIADVVVESFSANSNEIIEPYIVDIQPNYFTYRLVYGGTIYTAKKNSWQDVYIVRRKVNYRGDVRWLSEEPYCYNWADPPVKWWNVTSSFGYIKIDGIYQAVSGYARCVPAQLQTNPWCNIENCTTIVEYQYNGENSWHDISTNQKINILFEDTSFTEYFRCPERWYGGYLNNQYGFALKKSDIPNRVFTDSSYYIKVKDRLNSQTPVERFAVEFHTSQDYTYHFLISGWYKRFKAINETISKNETLETDIRGTSANAYYWSFAAWTAQQNSWLIATFSIDRFNRGIFDWNHVFNGISNGKNVIPSYYGIVWFTSWTIDGYTSSEWQMSSVSSASSELYMSVETKSNLKTAYAIVLIDRR